MAAILRRHARLAEFFFLAARRPAQPTRRIRAAFCRSSLRTYSMFSIACLTVFIGIANF